MMDTYGNTPLSLAIEHGNINFIPQEVLMDLADAVEIRQFTEIQEHLEDHLEALRQQQRPDDECGRGHLLLLAGSIDPIHAQLLGGFPV